MPTPQANPIRVLLVDDHAVVRTGLRMLIESRPGLKVIGEAANGSAALEMAGREHPEIILLDLDLGSDNGLDLLPELLATTTGSRVILLTGVRDPEIHYRAVRLGAMGVVLKEQAADVLVTAIETVHAGQAWLDPSLTARVLSGMSGTRRTQETNPETAKIAALTERERAVIALICEGLPNKQIGQRLHISETTVRHHLTSIFDKLGVTSRLELVIYAYRHGLPNRRASRL